MAAHKIFPFVMVLLMFGVGCGGGGSTSPTPGPKTLSASGFTIHVSVKAQASSACDPAVQRLSARLADALARAPRLAALNGKLAFWVTDSRFQSGSACYHPSSTWLSEHGMDPAMAQGIEIYHLDNFLAWCVDGDQPMLVLHEMAHGYHHQVMGSAQAEGLTRAYQAAKASGIYALVPYKTLDGPKLQAYALTSEQEYFAELCEAYFGVNDYFPFTRDQIAPFDSNGAKLLQEVWGQ